MALLIRVRFSVVALLLVLIFGCGPRNYTIQRKILAHGNPITYDFDKSLAEVQQAIKVACGNKWRMEQSSKDLPLTGMDTLQGSSLLWRGEADALSNFILQQPGNEQDAYLFGGDTSFGKSRIYVRGNTELPYFADFHLHLTTLGATKTRVEVFAYEPRVVVGINRSAVHGPAFIFLKVDATTVEEYEILRRIGAALHVEGMPDLIIPGLGSAEVDITKSSL